MSTVFSFGKEKRDLAFLSFRLPVTVSWLLWRRLFEDTLPASFLLKPSCCMLYFCSHALNHRKKQVTPLVVVNGATISAHHCQKQIMTSWRASWEKEPTHATELHSSIRHNIDNDDIWRHLDDLLVVFGTDSQDYKKKDQGRNKMQDFCHNDAVGGANEQAKVIWRMRSLLFKVRPECRDCGGDYISRGQRSPLCLHNSWSHSSLVLSPSDALRRDSILCAPRRVAPKQRALCILHIWSRTWCPGHC